MECAQGVYVHHGSLKEVILKNLVWVKHLSWIHQKQVLKCHDTLNIDWYHRCSVYGVFTYITTVTPPKMNAMSHEKGPFFKGNEIDESSNPTSNFQGRRFLRGFIPVFCPRNTYDQKIHVFSRFSVGRIQVPRGPRWILKQGGRAPNRSLLVECFFRGPEIRGQKYISFSGVIFFPLLIGVIHNST